MGDSVFNVSAWLDLLSQPTRFITLDTPSMDGLIIERIEGYEDGRHRARQKRLHLAADTMSVSTMDARPCATATNPNRYVPC